jgi:hypothetical protein
VAVGNYVHKERVGRGAHYSKLVPITHTNTPNHINNIYIKPRLALDSALGPNRKYTKVGLEMEWVEIDPAMAVLGPTSLCSRRPLSPFLYESSVCLCGLSCVYINHWGIKSAL